MVLFLLVFSETVFAQFAIEGQVTDSLTGNPLSNVNITIDGLKRGTVSGGNGFFTLTNLPAGRFKLHFTHIACQSRTVRVDLQRSQNLGIVRLLAESLVLKDVFITADRLERRAEEVPASTYTIPGKVAEVYAVNNADEMLLMIPGIRIDRDRGIFSKNSSISMRGLNGSARTLVLLDGAPINKADGGGINWSRIDPDAIERIEVIKGPNSTIYGGNAMGGVVNIITARNPGPFRARMKTFYGTYNTFGGNLSASGADINQNKGFFWSVNSFYRKGDGYFVVAEQERDSLDAKTYLEETGASFRVGYQFTAQNSIEAEYNYYWDKRGDGTFITEPGGSFNQYPSHFLRVKYQGTLSRWQLNANGFYQLENYRRQNETIRKQTGKYTLYETDSRRTDAGLWLTAALPMKNGSRLTTGIDAKAGKVEASDIYYTATDILTNKGNMDAGAAFVQFEMPVTGKKLSIEAGLRVDGARFHHGSFEVEAPTSFSAFMAEYPSQFHDTAWLAVSPRLALLFHQSPSFKTYLSFAHGFRAPTLDDMCRNGNITKGFKKANPLLGPENLNNFELGYTASLLTKLKIAHSAFVSTGNDFQYFIANGDSVYTGGNNLKPVMQRQNISNVLIYGTEVSLSWQPFNSLSVLANYAWNHAEIRSSENSNGRSLEGKRLMEVPEHQASGAIEWRYHWFMAGASLAYTGKLFADDDNLIVNQARTETGVRVSATYHEKIYLSLSMQDVLNNRYTDSKGNISPGRFMMCSVIWKWL